MAWSVEKACPHLQWWGTFFICHPYRKLSASRNPPLFKLKPWSFNGNTDNHDDDPFSPSRSIILRFGGDRLSLISWTALSVSCCFCQRKCVLIDCGCGLLNDLLCWTVISLSAWYSPLALVTGVMIFRAPWRIGKGKSLLSSGLH